jgi:hypothetical protein
MKSTWKPLALVALLTANAITSAAKEGMWIPTLLGAVEDEMQAMGLHLTAEDIYSVNQGSLKDAIVHFGGGCTAEVVSDQGLLLTNHHCGYGQIAFHSSVEHDYLTDGFWAMTREDELMNPGLTATFIDRIEDVTEQVAGADDAEATKEALVAAAVEGTDLEGAVVAFDFGNTHYLITTRTFRDVRLVGAPPSAVGKFGGDTDNWVWPRHTGDFSVFRIYADANNAPAEAADGNVPYRPAHHLPVQTGGVAPGDFTMVFGFPGATEQYLTSDAVAFVINELNPIRIGMRDAALTVINAARSSSPELRIGYADKQSSVANAWKKWIGQNKGLIELNALGKKEALEATFAKRAASAGNREYAASVPTIQSLNTEFFPYQTARALFIEYVYYGADILNFALAFQSVIESGEALESEGAWDEAMSELKASIEGHFRTYHAATDEALLGALTGPYTRHSPDPAFLPEVLSGITDGPEFARTLFAKSVFDDEAALLELVEKGSPKAFAKLAKDPAYSLISALRATYFERVAPEYGRLRKALDAETATFTRALRELFPDEAFFPDANSTLRLTYGKVEGSAPYDGMRYEPFTTHRGILQKYVPGDPDFDLPADLVEALKTEAWGEYANADGDLPVCFTGSNHTTGGNSGSPALNGRGELIGINFDRTWESTMSDILFDESRCRNIMVDIRYVLWVIDVYAGAGHLVEEMDVVR